MKALKGYLGNWGLFIKDVKRKKFNPHKKLVSSVRSVCPPLKL